MKAIILAAGYGTRLDQGIERMKEEDPGRYNKIKSSIEGRAKPMILIAGKPVVQYAVENMERAGISQIFIITNNKYHRQFEEWLDSYDSRAKIKLINDMTDRNEERLGAVNDLLLVLKEEHIDDDVLVFAGDNLLKFELKELIRFFNSRHTSILVAYLETDKERLKRSACIQFDENQLVVSFEEKPEDPRSEWICPSVYIYTGDTIRLINSMRFDDDKKDLIGNIPLLLYSRIPFHAFCREDKIRFDLGTIDDFDAANEHFSK